MSLRWTSSSCGYRAILAARLIADPGLSSSCRRTSASRRSSSAVDTRARGRDARPSAAVVEFEDGGWRIDPESTLDDEYEKDPRLYYVVSEGTLSQPESSTACTSAVILRSPFARPDTWALIARAEIAGRRRHVREASGGMPSEPTGAR